MSFRAVCGGVFALLVAGVAMADPRPFTFTYDLYPEGKGNWEYEQWVTWKHGEDSDRIDFRQEIEIGVTDYFDLSFYVPTWSIEDSQAKWDSVGVEGIVYLTNPVTDPVGFGLYGEINVGEDELEFEQKVLVQKDIGNWTLAYNLIIETEIEHEDGENEVEGILGHALGVSYAVSPSWRLGGEAVVESKFADWRQYEDTTVYAGPAIGYHGGKNWWVTVSPLAQLTDVDEEADFQIRVIGGLEF